VIEQFPWEPIADKAATLVVACSEAALGRGLRCAGPITGLSEFVSRIYHVARRRVTGSPVRNWIAVNNRTVGILDFGLEAAGRLALFEEGWHAGQGWLAFRRSYLPESSAQTQSNTAQPVALQIDEAYPDIPNRILDNNQLLQAGDALYQSHHLDIGRPPVSRRWSL
jgi:hypothetical protein